MTTCKGCAPLYYTDLLHESICTVCPTGYETLVTRSVACFTCPVGKFGNGTDKPCDKCVPGRFRQDDDVADNTALNRCRLCPAGYFQSYFGQGLCDSCEAGKYSGEEGTVHCKECMTHHFTPASAETVCSSCPNGWEAQNNQSATCSRCPTGKFGVDGVLGCTVCAVGSYRENGDVNLDECKHCETGRYQPLQGQGNCLVCPSGKFQKEKGFTFCPLCPSGYYRLGKDLNSTRCPRCPAGQTTLKNGTEACSGTCEFLDFWCLFVV